MIKISRLITCIGFGLMLASPLVMAEITLRNTITGEALDMSFAKKGGDTEAFKQFMKDGKTPTTARKTSKKKARAMYMTGCSGCHGHEAEGKLGPGLADDYWTYPRNGTDIGLFETLFGGANGMMGPQYVNFTTDEMLQIMAFLRSIYTGDKSKAEWLKQ